MIIFTGNDTTINGAIIASFLKAIKNSEVIDTNLNIGDLNFYLEAPIVFIDEKITAIFTNIELKRAGVVKAISLKEFISNGFSIVPKKTISETNKLDKDKGIIELENFVFQSAIQD
jgi:hypothetical protein